MASKVLRVFMSGIHDEVRHWKVTNLVSFSVVKHWSMYGRAGATAWAKHLKENEKLIEQPEVVTENDGSFPVLGEKEMFKFILEDFIVKLLIPEVSIGCDELEEDMRKRCEISHPDPVDPLTKLRDLVRRLQEQPKKSTADLRNIVIMRQQIKVLENEAVATKAAKIEFIFQDQEKKK